MIKHDGWLQVVIISSWRGEQIITSFTQGYFVPSLVEIDPVVLEKKIFNFVNAFSLLSPFSPSFEQT